MQNIEAILKELGIEVPEDKKSDLTKKVSENYVTKAEHDKKISRAESDRDAWKEKAETAEETLKGFEGIDPAQVQAQLAEYKKKAEDAEKDRDQKLYERDFADALKAELEGTKFSSEGAKRDAVSQIKEAGLKLKDGKILGLTDFLAQMKEKDASAFVDEEQENALKNAAHFGPVTAPRGQQTPPGKMTRKEIGEIKDASERQAAIAQNLSLYPGAGKGV